MIFSKFTSIAKIFFEWSSYLDFKKDVDSYVHIKMFNFAMKANAKTSKEYIINAFSCTLRDTWDWCHNYISNFLNCIFSKLT